MSEHLHHHHDDNDPAGKRVGIQAAIFAVLLAIVTIASHRTHTSAIIHKSTANDQWAYYQATRIKLHTSELGLSMIELTGKGSEAAEKMKASYEKDAKKYESTSDKNRETAEAEEKLTEADEHKALRFDIGEGLLEIGLVLSSLYFIARKNMFPVMGILAAVAGSVVAVTGFLMQ